MVMLNADSNSENWMLMTIPAIGSLHIELGPSLVHRFTLSLCYLGANIKNWMLMTITYSWVITHWVGAQPVPQVSLQSLSATVISAYHRLWLFAMHFCTVMTVKTEIHFYLFFIFICCIFILESWVVVGHNSHSSLEILWILVLCVFFPTSICLLINRQMVPSLMRGEGGTL